MKITNLRSFCSIIMMFLVVAANAQTITLTPDPTLDPTVGPCTLITPGTTLSFDRTTACDEGILITRTDVFPPLELVLSEDAVVSYTFADEGDYVVFCGAPPTVGSVAVNAVCINVNEANAAPIPTLGEWGIIFLVLAAMIIGIIALRQPNSAKLQA